MKTKRYYYTKAQVAAMDRTKDWDANERRSDPEVAKIIALRGETNVFSKQNHLRWKDRQEARAKRNGVTQPRRVAKAKRVAQPTKAAVEVHFCPNCGCDIQAVQVALSL